MTRTCRRCGDRFAIREPRQEHCMRCAAEVAYLIDADERRRRPRFQTKDFTGTTPL